MKLYSIQPLLVYEHLLTGASWTANPFAGEEPADDVFLRAYDWLAGQMRSYGRHPEDRATQYPVWAWYWWAGLTRPKPDLRTASLRNWGNGGPNVLLTLDIPEDRVVLTDFDAWHWVLNYWYLGQSAEAEAFEARCEAVGPSYYREKPLANADLHNELQASWRHIFDVETAGRLLEIAPSKNCVQGTFWELHPGDVVDVVQFSKKGRSRVLPPPVRP